MEPDETGHHGEPFDPYDQIFREMGAEKGLDVFMVRRPIRDLDIPSKEQMVAILDEIDRFLGQGLPVYVHCWGGRGRTWTVVGCWLVRQGLDGQEALERIKYLRRYEAMNHKPSPEMEEQIRMVLNWRNG
jgi:protein-tyrosine phosphatase